MIKKLLITYLFLITNVFAGLPPTTMRGQSQTLKPTTFNFQVPNKQATITAASTSLIETGNNNELENRGFEHTTVTTGWTISNATSSSSTTRIEGSKSLSLALTGALSLSQSSTINASQKSGVQMVASIWVNSSDVSDLQLCSLKNGSEDKCTVTGGYVQGSGWRQLTVSFIGDSTSNGLKLKSTDTTGTVLVDQAFVGIGSPVVDFTPDMVYSAKVSATGVVSDENTDWISSCTWASAGVGYCNFNAGIFTVAPNCTATINIDDSTTYAGNTVSSITKDYLYFRTQASPSGSVSRPLIINCQKQGADYKTSKAYVSSSSDFGYTNAGAITITATTTNPTKGVIVIDRVLKSRAGQNLKAIYNYEQSSGGSAGSGDYLFSLPSGLSFDTSLVQFSTSAFGSQSNSKAVVGYGSAIDGTSNINSVLLIAYDATRFRAQITYNGTNTSGINSSNIQLSGNRAYTFILDAPIQGWTDSGVIVGSFEGIEKCATANECNDTFSAIITTGTGVVANENTDWIDGNCTAANSPVCTFKAGIFTQVPNCTTAPYQSSVFARIESQSSGSISLSSPNTSGSHVTTQVYLICQKTGVDYKPKTAKIASSIGVPTVPGVTTQAIDTFSTAYGGATISTVCPTSSSCTLYNQIGNGFTSITQSTAGAFTVNFSKTYSNVNCTATTLSASTMAPPVNSGTTPPMSCSNCSSLTFVTGNPASAYVATYGTVNCQGSY